MSLFLGNLSPHIRRDELERVFRRFGRSNVQLKDGYGFVIYDVTSNAERALQALRGKNICGEPIALTWSNKQPKHFKKFSRNARFSESYRGRKFFTKESIRNNGSQDRRDFTKDTKYPNNNRGRAPRVDLPGKGVGSGHDDIDDHGGVKAQNAKEVGTVAAGEGGPLESNLEENDRWGDLIVDSEDYAVENETGFERYEPYHGFDRRDEEESRTMVDGSPTHRNSPEKSSRERSGDNQKPRQTCYICGLVGHIRRNCPQIDRRNKFNNFTRGERGSKRPGPTSWGRQSASRDSFLRRKTSEFPRSNRSNDFLSSKNNRHFGHTEDSLRKKRSRTEHKTSKKHHGEKGRSDRSPLYLESTTSISRSQSLPSRSMSGISSHSASQSRSASSDSHSFSSSSKSFPSLSPSKSKSGSSRYRSKSSSPRSLSSIVPLEHQLPVAPTKVQGDSPKNLSLGKEKHSAEGDESSKSSVLKCLSAAVEEETALSFFTAKEEWLKDYPHRSTNKTGFDEKVISRSTMKEDTYIGEEYSEVIKETVVEKYDPAEMMDLKPIQFGKPNPQIPITNDSLQISSQELHTVLKHYGLPVPNENELPSSPKTYFGAARLWPWEMIYYRRLKKGPISTDNYARRVEQNREFGIIDKYIRSSSGWGEGTL